MRMSYIPCSWLPVPIIASICAQICSRVPFSRQFTKYINSVKESGKIQTLVIVPRLPYVRLHASPLDRLRIRASRKPENPRKGKGLAPRCGGLSLGGRREGTYSHVKVKAVGEVATEVVLLDVDFSELSYHHMAQIRLVHVRRPRHGHSLEAHHAIDMQHAFTGHPPDEHRPFTHRPLGRSMEAGMRLLRFIHLARRAAWGGSPRNKPFQS